MLPPELPQFDDRTSPPEILQSLTHFCRDYCRFLAPSFTSKMARFLSKLRHFVESPVTWGAVTFIVSAYADDSRKWLVMFGLFFLGVAILKENFFAGHTWKTHVLGYGILFCFLFLGFRHLPSPKDPLTRNAVGDEMDSRIRDIRSGMNTLLVQRESPTSLPPTTSLTTREAIDEAFKKLQASGLVVTQATPSSQSAFSGLSTENLRAAAMDFTQSTLIVVGRWNNQINEAMDRLSKAGTYGPVYARGLMNLHNEFVKDMEPRIARANDLRIVMLSRITSLTEDDVTQSKWFELALRGQGVDVIPVANAISYLQQLSYRMQ